MTPTCLYSDTCWCDTSTNRERLHNLWQTLRSLSPTTDLLHELVGAGHFVEMAMTRDGLLIGRPPRSAGFEAFIGRPNEGMLQRTDQLWKELTADEKGVVLERLEAQDIKPARVGIELEPLRSRAVS